MYLENVSINCHEIYQRAKPQQQTRIFSNIYHKPHMIYLNLKKK